MTLGGGGLREPGGGLREPSGRTRPAYRKIPLRQKSMRTCLGLPLVVKVR